MLIAYLMVLGICFVFAASCVVAYQLQKHLNHFWIYSYILGFSPIILIAGYRYAPQLENNWLFSMAVHGNTDFILTAICVPLLLIPTLMKLPEKRTRIIISLFVPLVFFSYSLRPFLSFAINYHKIANLPTTFSKDGICQQNSNFSCGPAAAATAVNSLGIKTNQAEIALRAMTTPAFGTQIDQMLISLRKNYYDQGLRCKFHHFKSIQELKQKSLPCLAVIKYSFMVDHFVAILEITDDKVIYADPLMPLKVEEDHETFMENWRKVGICLSRTSEVPAQAVEPQQ